MNEVDLPKIRKTYGLTQSALAESLGVSRKTISNWENGVHGIPKHMSNKIIELYPIGQTVTHSPSKMEEMMLDMAEIKGLLRKLLTLEEQLISISGGNDGSLSRKKFPHDDPKS